MKGKSIHILIALLLLLQSCIKESAPICNGSLLLKFRYTLNNQNTDLFGAEIHKVTVYVFDINGKYVNSFQEEGDKLSSDYVMRIPLPAGQYSVIAYGGDFTTYSAGELNGLNNTLSSVLRKGVTDISDFRTELKSISGAENYLYPIATPDDLYAGFTDNAVSVFDNHNITEIELIKNTKKIKVKITTSDPIVAPFNIYVTGLNGRYLPDDNIDLDHGTFKYTPFDQTVESNYMEADLKTMRLMLGQSPRLVIKDGQTSAVIYDQNIVEQILLNPQYSTQKDIDREDQFIFEITILSKDNNIQMVVSVNGWIINEITPDI